MASGDEQFLRRWSRLKREHAGEPAEVAAPAVPARAPDAEATGAPALPPVEALTPESDFTTFMNPQVADALRRLALKKLFRHPDIDVPDPYEPFSGDWTTGESIPEEMLKSLYQSRRSIARGLDPRMEQRERSEPAAHAQDPEAETPAPQELPDDTGRQEP